MLCYAVVVKSWIGWVDAMERCGNVDAGEYHIIVVRLLGGGVYFCFPLTGYSSSMIPFEVS